MSDLKKIETVEDKLKRTQEELGQHVRVSRRRTIKAGALGFVFGAAFGATGMVYCYEQHIKPQPVVVERPVAGERVDLEAQIKVLNAKVEANYTQQMQRQKEVRFKTEKLELAKQVHGTQLVTAQEGADHIRQMARELGITKMVMK